MGTAELALYLTRGAGGSQLSRSLPFALWGQNSKASFFTQPIRRRPGAECANLLSLLGLPWFVGKQWLRWKGLSLCFFPFPSLLLPWERPENTGLKPVLRLCF